MLNQRYGQLVIIGVAPSYRGKARQWECQCDCGNIKVIRANALRRGDTTSCGCAQKKAVTTHGGKGTRLYQTWINLRRRCNDPNSKGYKNYGGRGITYPSDWEDFAKFREWALSTGYTDQLTIERRNVDKDYSSSNCYWAGWDIQAANRRKRQNKSSQYIGVTRKRDRWEASIKHDHKSIYIGFYNTELDAAQARDQYVKDNNLPHKLNF